MFEDAQALAEKAVMERTTLLLNHVIASEPAAMDRLRPHTGRAIQVEFTGWPSLLPPLPAVGYRITPAGLLEWLGAESLPDPDLRLAVDASNPALALARFFTGTRPEVSVAGDAGFAADVDWLIENLRWDIEDDLAKVVGPAPARQLGRLAEVVAAGLRKAVRTLGDLTGRGGATAPAGPKNR